MYWRSILKPIRTLTQHVPVFVGQVQFPTSLIPPGFFNYLLVLALRFLVNARRGASETAERAGMHVSSATRDSNAAMAERSS